MPDRNVAGATTVTLAPRAAPPPPPLPEPAALAWARTYLPAYFSDRPARFHADLFRVLTEEGARLVACVAPRGHAKSTCAALAYPLWCICQRRRRNIVIVTHETSLATQFVTDIRLELESNERILADYGDLQASEEEDAPTATRSRRRQAAWGRTRFTTNTGITVQAKGTGASFRGLRVGPQRPDLVICDDVEKDRHVAQPEARRRLEHWLRRVVLPALAPGGQLLVLGSLLHYDALLANLRDPERYRGWRYLVYRALEAECDANGDWWPVPLWPARWPVARLEEERRRIGTAAFEQEYQANPMDDAQRVFLPDWLRPYDPRELAGKRFVHLIAVDPATGKRDRDFFALWVGGVDQATGVIYTRELMLTRVNFVEQVRLVVAAYRRWRPVRVGVETVAYQKALLDAVEDVGRKERLYIPVVALQPKIMKEVRIAASAVQYENGTFRLPPGLDPEVEAQFLHYPKGAHDDAPDVCALGIELARGLGTGQSVGVGPRRPKDRRGSRAEF